MLVSGKKPIAGANIAPATARTAGAMPAADKVKLDTLADGGWYDSTVLAMLAACPGLSNFSYYGFRDTSKIGTHAIGGVTATIADSGLIGGGLQYQTSGGSKEYQITPSMLAVPRNQVFAFAVRAKFPIPAAGQYAGVTFSYSGGSHSHGFMSQYDVSVDARTKMVLNSYTADASQLAASSFVIDTSPHTCIYAWDLSSVKFLIDGASILTIANGSNYVSPSQCKMIVCGSSAVMVLTDLIFGY